MSFQGLRQGLDFFFGEVKFCTILINFIKLDTIIYILNSNFASTCCSLKLLIFFLYFKKGVKISFWFKQVKSICKWSNLFAINWEKYKNNFVVVMYMRRHNHSFIDNLQPWFSIINFQIVSLKLATGRVVSAE